MTCLCRLLKMINAVHGVMRPVLPTPGVFCARRVLVAESTFCYTA